MTRGTGALSAPIFRLALFIVGLGLLAGVGALMGRASGIDADDTDGSATDGAMTHSASATPREVGNGLSNSSAGFRLVLAPTTFPAGLRKQLRLRIIDDSGSAVTSLDEDHGEPPLHLIVVRRDLTGYRHLHPIRSGGGFRVDLTLPTPGVWRAFADFEIDGEKVVLGRDLVVPGELTPRTLPDPALSAEAKGYRVELTAGELRAGVEETVRFDITRADDQVELEPYLGASGHLVAIRESDLAYLHVHPLERSHTNGVSFVAEFTEPGRYGLFLQFKHAGRVQTVPFTVEVSR